MFLSMNFDNFQYFLKYSHTQILKGTNIYLKEFLNSIVPFSNLTDCAPLMLKQTFL